MQLVSGYHFFQGGKELPGCGFVLVSVLKNMVKIQCVAEQIPSGEGRQPILCLVSSSDPENPFVIGKMSLFPSGKQLRGEMRLTLKKFNASLWRKYDCYALIGNSGKILLQTAVMKKEAAIFDPFNTTNPSYSWNRAESPEELVRSLSYQKITLLPEVSAEVKEGFSKYRHILTGNYKSQQKSYFIIGIPGDRPAPRKDSIYRWINKVVSIEEYPFFEGYKLYYFDNETSAAVKAVLRTQPAGNQR